MSAPPIAEAKPKTKSRTGCQECKAKRLKCDEARPGCKQCLRRKRSCPGYRREFRWSTKYEKVTPGIVMTGLPTAHLASSIETLLPVSKKRKMTIGNALPSSSGSSGLETNGKDGTSLPSSPSKDLTLGLDSEEIAQMDLEVMAAAGVLTDEELAYTLDEVYDEFGLPAFLSDNIISVEDFLVDTSTDGDRRLCSPDEPISNDETSLPLSSTSTSLALRRDTSNPFVLTLPKAPLDMSSLLVRYWFSDVCTMWSAFDSDINPNRQLASSTWSISEPVYCALQYMAATCLADTLPHVKPHVLGLAQQALESIQQWKIASAVNGESRNLPADLLLAIFAVGTTLCWTDTKQLGLQLLSDARQILSEYAPRAGVLDRDGRRYLAHFQAALIYWDMLAKAIGDIEPSPLTRPQAHSESLDQPRHQGAATSHSHESATIAPHPWTGVSTNVHQVFGTVMELCRHSRVRAQNHNGTSMTATMLREALSDIEHGQRIAEQLNDLAFVTQADSPKRVCDPVKQETRDDRTPIQHFVDIAEAYRLAALVQLYLTFPEDLESPQHLELDNEASVVTTLALELVEVLHRIPVTSGTRCIQPLLYISAAAGLKYSPPTADAADPFSSLSAMPTLTDQHLCIAQARQSVLNRLSVLEGSLPRRPIAVAAKLAKAVWQDYDGASGEIVVSTRNAGYREQACGGGHWMDTMFRTGHWTLFG